jgi:hypothetical protein
VSDAGRWCLKTASARDDVRGSSVYAEPPPLLSRTLKLIQAVVVVVAVASVWSVVTEAPDLSRPPDEMGSAAPGGKPSGKRSALAVDRAGGQDDEEGSAEDEPEAEADEGEDDNAPPTAGELRVQRELETQQRGDSRSDRITTVQGRVLSGRILQESASSVQLLRSFGDSGDMEMTIDRGDIASIERGHRTIPPAITIRDVRFKMEFPDFNIYRRPPFTIVTDQSFFEVEDATRMLEKLHTDFVRMFQPLITRPERSDGIQLLFFSDEAKFAAYRDHYAPAIGYASGFYSPMKDRLVIFDQENSEMFNKIHREIDGEKKRHSRRHNQVAVHEWHNQVKRSLGSAADRLNKVVIRHEGAHQLFHQYGVHSAHGAENLWLIEGLASFCEDEDDGSVPFRVMELRALDDSRNRLPFLKLINYASRESLSGLGSEAELDVAYPKAWLIVNHLMRNDRREFFEYIRFVRDPENVRKVRRTPAAEILAEFLGRTTEQLDGELRRQLNRL